MPKKIFFAKNFYGGLVHCKTWLLVTNISTLVQRIKVTSVSEVSACCLRPSLLREIGLISTFFFISLSITGTVLLKIWIFYFTFMGSGNIIDKNCSTNKRKLSHIQCNFDFSKCVGLQSFYLTIDTFCLLEHTSFFLMLHDFRSER